MPQPSLRPGIVIDPPTEVVTGRPIKVPGNANVFDLTVSAFQGYGGGGGGDNRRRPPTYGSSPAAGPVRRRVPGAPIITKAQPGDEFVRIDGKRTYFDIGPTVDPNAGLRPQTPNGKIQLL